MAKRRPARKSSATRSTSVRKYRKSRTKKRVGKKRPSRRVTRKISRSTSGHKRRASKSKSKSKKRRKTRTFLPFRLYGGSDNLVHGTAPGAEEHSAQHAEGDNASITEPHGA